MRAENLSFDVRLHWVEALLDPVSLTLNVIVTLNPISTNSQGMSRDTQSRVTPHPKGVSPESVVLLDPEGVTQQIGASTDPKGVVQEASGPKVSWKETRLLDGL